jgi:hypothetical protein
MSHSSTGILLRHLRRLVASDSPDVECDAALLSRFVTTHDHDAFAAWCATILVWSGMFAVAA